MKPSTRHRTSMPVADDVILSRSTEALILREESTNACHPAAGTTLAKPQAAGWSLSLVMAAAALVLFPCLSFYLFEPDEGRYAQIPREMLERGDWLVPTLQGAPYLDKPPLFYWLVMLSYAVFGYHDWAARIVPALAVQIGVLATFLFGRRVFGERAAFWGSLTLGLIPGFVFMGRLLVLDGVFTLWVMLSLYGAYLALDGLSLRWRWWLFSAVACGLGVLTKGPVAAVLVMAPLGLHRLCGGRVNVGWRGIAAFAGIVLAVNLPWYVLICLRLPEFAAHFFWQHNVLRFAQPFDHERPFWFFGPILLAGLLPVVLLIVPFGRFVYASRRSAALRFLLLASLWCVGFFSLSGSKLPTYILPAFPPLALAFGVFLAETKYGRARGVIVMFVGWWLITIASHWFAVPHVARVRSPMNDPERMTAWCGDRSVPVICFPRNVDSVAFYVGRDDFRDYRSKDIARCVADLEKHERSVVLFGHRNSLETLRLHLPPHLRVAEHAPMGLTKVGVVVRSPSAPR